MAEAVRGAGGGIAFLTPCAALAGIAEVGFPAHPDQLPKKDGMRIKQTAPAKRRKTVEQRPDGT
eukprot:1200515-Pyramimonas_sp.AAC.1